MCNHNEFGIPKQLSPPFPRLSWCFFFSALSSISLKPSATQSSYFVHHPIQTTRRHSLRTDALRNHVGLCDGLPLLPCCFQRGCPIGHKQQGWLSIKRADSWCANPLTLTSLSTNSSSLLTQHPFVYISSSSSAPLIRKSCWC